MSKRDELMKGLGNVRESMGDFGAVRGAPPAAGPRAVPPHLVGVARSRDVSQIALDRIDRDPDQPREEFDEEALGRLAESLRRRGQLQPIRVRWDEGRGRYIILCGERRWRAARMAGLESLSCVVVEGTYSAAERRAVQLVENALREDLRPIEQAKAFRALKDSEGWSDRQLAAELSIHHAQVVRALALLELPESIQDRVEQGGIAPATAYEISKVDDPAEREALAARVVTEGLTRSETIEAVRRSAPGGARRTGKGRGAGPKGGPIRIRTAAGLVITAARQRGNRPIEPSTLRAALVEALERLDAEEGQEGEAGPSAAA